MIFAKDLSKNRPKSAKIDRYLSFELIRVNKVGDQNYNVAAPKPAMQKKLFKIL